MEQTTNNNKYNNGNDERTNNNNQSQRRLWAQVPHHLQPIEMQTDIQDEADKFNRELNKFKEEKANNGFITAKSLNKLGHPCFIKTKFKKSTIDKFRTVCGKFFGIQC